MAVQTVARLRYVSIPPRKMRQVTELVKGLPVEKALNILNFTPKIAARHVAKTLKSAAANALSLEGTAHLHPEDLFVKEIFVQPAPAYKRIRFRSMGRVYRYKKRHCHLTVKLEERPQAATPKPKTTTTVEKKTKAKKTAGKKAAPKKTVTKKTAAKKTSAKKAVAGKTAADTGKTKKRKTAGKAESEE